MLTITIGFLDLENIPMNNFTNTLAQEDQNPERGLQQPPLAVDIS